MSKAEEKIRTLKTVGCGTPHYSLAKGSATRPGSVLAALPIYKAEVVGFKKGYDAARAGTSTTIWSK